METIIYFTFKSFIIDIIMNESNFQDRRIKEKELYLMNFNSTTYFVSYCLKRHTHGLFTRNIFINYFRIKI